MKDNRIHMIFALFTMALVMLGCSQVEFDNLAEYPVPETNSHMDNIAGLRNPIGWNIYALYFLDKESGKIKAKIRKAIHGNQWYYYKCDSVGGYQVIKDIDPLILAADYELGNVAHSFTFRGDTIRLHRCGYYPKDNPQYALLVVTRRSE